MDWMRLAVELTREAMRVGSAPEREPQKPVDLGTALTEQFALIDRNIDSVVGTVNAHHAKLEQTIRRQKIWNIVLAAGIVIAVIVALIR
jgi:hypothetical protein